MKEFIDVQAVNAKLAEIEDLAIHSETGSGICTCGERLIWTRKPHCWEAKCDAGHEMGGPL